ncbi:hypothetical protein [Sinorhizobium medicae]|uniref:hypothetical protein n=1 Tax=Sinorhizobium medicae TaxID=110321 RepID=UPI000FD98D69|nr:hypothetical protein [Sinorhizobium medicae]RVP47348.1 hypothetical protein CN078_26905 [Sinorhizobium medicae]RVP75451.1 hypothetical protein CN079_20160 [Sinorhizobium medicae]UWU06573.1 hypothetical protein N2598_09260 [Sinorhizobium medicae]
MMDDDRRMWLRGAYLDRIIETAQAYAASHTYFVDAEWEPFIAGEFAYLTELSAVDQAYLREQAGLEAFRRIVSALSTAREEAFGKLRDDNTDVIQPDAAFRLDIGWLRLLQHAADRVRTYPEEWKVKIVGAKEKFGCAIVHISCDYDQRGCRFEVERLREEVRLRSLATCEICGSSGRLRLSGYAKTVCDRHAPVMGEFREDDGKWADPWAWNDASSVVEDYIDDVLDKGRALIAEAEHRKRQNCDEYPAEAAEVLKDLLPVLPRPKDHVVDLMPQTAVARQIERDMEKDHGRKADLLLEFCGKIEIAIVAAMSGEDDDVDFWIRSEIDRWQGAQPLSDDDREWLRRYLRSLAIDERGRRQRREDGANALQAFFADNPVLEQEAEKLSSRERELLDAYAGDLADSARGSVVKEEFLDGYVRDEVALWPGVEDLSDYDREWLRQWLRRMIDAEYERIRRKQSEE